MHSLILFIAIVVLTFSGGICQYVGPEKNQTIELFSEGVSAWISSDQYYQIFSSLENDMYNENSCTQMSINVAVYISQVMTAAQAAKFTAIIANITVNSNLNVADLYVILGNHLRATVCTFWDGD
uniref:Uncharacterized protein n=1 Tax=Acrobeloides nanus TaxID=290746 RepID=A0A914D5J8_9BILA